MVLTEADLSRARRTGFFGEIPSAGAASVDIIIVTGSDASQFLAGQLTSDVMNLGAGAGHRTARVKRTGHLEYLFSLYRAGDGDRFYILIEGGQSSGLLASLDMYLFTEDVCFELMVDLKGVMAQGHNAHDLLTEIQSTGSDDVIEDGNSLAFKISMVGDQGFVFFEREKTDVSLNIAMAAGKLEFLSASTDQLNYVVDQLRVEAGIVRVGVDFDTGSRLLPEVGVEADTVSYTKGCYLGQEVIARVRTYGSVRRQLVGLALESGLKQLPAPKNNLVTTDGDIAGIAASVGYSPTLERPILLAFMGRNYRTPDQEISIESAGDIFTAKIVQLPVYAARSQDELANTLYEQGVRAYAEKKEALSLSLMEQAIRTNPRHVDAYEAIGVILGKAQKYHEAIDFFKRLQLLLPEEPMVHTNLSIYYMRLGDKETAEEEAALAASKSLAKGNSILSPVELSNKQRDERVENARRKADMFQRVLEFDPVDPVALFGLGSAFATLGQWQQSVEMMERCVDVDPKNSAAYASLGKCYEELEEDVAAIEWYQKGVKMAARNGDLMPLKRMEYRLLLLRR